MTLLKSTATSDLAGGSYRFCNSYTVKAAGRRVMSVLFLFFIEQILSDGGVGWQRSRVVGTVSRNRVRSKSHQNHLSFGSSAKQETEEMSRR